MSIKDLNIDDYDSKYFNNVTLQYEVIGQLITIKYERIIMEQLIMKAKVVCSSGGKNLRAYFEDGTEIY